MSKVYAALVLSQVLFGINFVVGKELLENISPYQLSCLRFLTAGFLLIVFLKLKNKLSSGLSSKTWMQLIVISIFGIGISQTMFLMGLKFSTAVNTSILSMTIPLFTMVSSIVRGKLQSSMSLFLGFLLSFIGVLFIFENRIREGVSFSQGDVMTLFGCVCIGVYLSYAKDLFEKVNSIEATGYMFLVGGLCLIPSFFVTGVSVGAEILTFKNILLFCYTALGASLGAYLLNHWAVSKLDSTRVSFFVFIQPMVAVITGVTTLGESFSLSSLVGFGFVLAGLMVALKKGYRRGSEEESVV